MTTTFAIGELSVILDAEQDTGADAVQHPQLRAVDIVASGDVLTADDNLAYLPTLLLRLRQDIARLEAGFSPDTVAALASLTASEAFRLLALLRAILEGVEPHSASVPEES